MKLHEARVLVTGGGSGIGRATARSLVQSGAKVALVGRDASRLRMTASEVGAVAIPGDVRDEGDVKRFVAAAIRELGDLNVLVNNAGIGTFGPLVETSAEDFRRVWETNTLGAMLVGRECAQYFLTRRARAAPAAPDLGSASIPSGSTLAGAPADGHLVGGPGGNIVNIGSTAAQRGFAGGSAYCASKFALTALTECWRAELRGSDVRVMQVNPSEVQNEFGEHAGRPARKGVNPTKLVSEDIAHVIVSLLSLEGRGFVTDAAVWATNPR